MFGSLVNVTNPTAHPGQHREVLSGGSVFARNGILNTNLINILPPSFEAGCGGIDILRRSLQHCLRRAAHAAVSRRCLECCELRLQACARLHVSELRRGHGLAAREDPGADSAQPMPSESHQDEKRGLWRANRAIQTVAKVNSFPRAQDLPSRRCYPRPGATPRVSLRHAKG
jgi:hypothetical protein